MSKYKGENKWQICGKFWYVLESANYAWNRIDGEIITGLVMSPNMHGKYRHM